MTGRPPPKRHPAPSRKLIPGKNLPRVKAPSMQIEGVVTSLSQEERPFLYEGCPEITYGGHTYYLAASSVEKYGAITLSLYNPWNNQVTEVAFRFLKDCIFD